MPAGTDVDARARVDANRRGEHVGIQVLRFYRLVDVAKHLPAMLPRLAKKLRVTMDWTLDLCSAEKSNS